jgi:agmatine deiminase
MTSITTRSFFLSLAVLFLSAMPALAQPTGPVRMVAEWEPALGTLISWPLGIPQDLVVELARDDLLYVLVNSAGAQSNAASTFSAWGIDPARVTYIMSSVQTHWPRDWGPHQVFDGSGQLTVIDPEFDGYPWISQPCAPVTSPGGYSGDDQVPAEVASFLGVPSVYFPGYVVGGNFIVDGHKHAFATCQMIGENQQVMTEAQFRAMTDSYLGISVLTIVTNTEDYGIQHIDCWFKLLDEERMLVKLPPVGHEEYDRIEANIAQFESLTNAFGRPYEIIRIPCPPYNGNDVANYCNSLILNGKVLVPLFNIPGDAVALQVWRDAMPGYEIIGFPWSDWYYYDALHCRTRAVFDPGMLRITHARLHDQTPGVTPQVFTTIEDYSNTGLIASSLQVWYRVNSGPWQSVPLAAAPRVDEYIAMLPAGAIGDEVAYYITAEDNSGRQETLPRTAPEGTFRYTVIDPGLTIAIPDVPPSIPPATILPLVAELDPGIDAIVPGSVQLHVNVNSGGWTDLPMSQLRAAQYTADLPRVRCGDVVQYYVSAEGDITGVKTWPTGGSAEPAMLPVGEPTPQVMFETGFEQDLPAGWTAGGLWHATSACAPTACEGSSFMYFGLESTCTYDTGAQAVGSLTYGSLALPNVPAGGSITLMYCSRFETENELGYDLAFVTVNGQQVDVPSETTAWQMHSVDLTSWAGQTVSLGFTFDSVDDFYNTFLGWQVDDLRITADVLTCVQPCPADFDDSGSVDVDDFFALLQHWGPCPAPPEACPWDVTGDDGQVGVDDFFALLQHWGPCD